MRSVIALVLIFPLLGFAQSSNPVYDKLAKIPANAEIEVRLTSGARIQGRLLRFDQKEVQISGQTTPIPISEIKSVKQVKRAPVWSPIWGFAGNWKNAAILAGVFVVVIVVVATNTR